MAYENQVIDGKPPKGRAPNNLIKGALSKVKKRVMSKGYRSKRKKNK